MIFTAFINRVSQKEIIQQNIFIVENLNVASKKPDEHSDITIYFKDLTTAYGKKLPKFATPPSIVIASRIKLWPLISSITNESFKINVDSRITVGDEKLLEPVFDLWISQHPTKSVQ